MNWRMILIISAALNILLAVVVFKARQSVSPFETSGYVATIVFKTNHLTRSITNIIHYDSPTAPKEVVWPTWSQIADEEWTGYRDNLLAYDCPPGTVRDILESELKRQHFDERQLASAPVNQKFWDLITEHSLDDNIPEFEALEQDLKDLETGYNKLQNEVFNGIPKKTGKPQHPKSPQYAHLNEELHSQLAELDAEYRKKQETISRDEEHRDERNRVTKEGRKAIQKLADEQAAARRELMSVEEFQEYRLRTSRNTEWAANLRGFEPTPEEKRQVAEWQLAMNDEFAQPGRNAPNRRKKIEERRAARARSDESMKDLFGDERYAVYERSKDGNYQVFFDLGDVFKLPETSVNSAWEMQRAAIDTAAGIRSNNDLTLVQKREALRGIQQETRDSLGGLLSSEYFQAYERKAGDWINQLSRVRN